MTARKRRPEVVVGKASALLAHLLQEQGITALVTECQKWIDGDAAPPAQIARAVRTTIATLDYHVRAAASLDFLSEMVCKTGLEQVLVTPAHERGLLADQNRRRALGQKRLRWTLFLPMRAHQALYQFAIALRMRPRDFLNLWLDRALEFAILRAEDLLRETRTAPVAEMLKRQRKSAIWKKCLTAIREAQRKVNLPVIPDRPLPHLADEQCRELLYLVLTHLRAAPSDADPLHYAAVYHCHLTEDERTGQPDPADMLRAALAVFSGKS